MRTALLVVAGAGLILGPAAPAQARWQGRMPLMSEERGEPLYAIRPPNVFYHNVGLIQMLVTNIGVVGNMLPNDAYGASWQGGEYLYAASLWIGAIAPDNLAYVSTGAYDNEMLPPIGSLYTIYESYEGIHGGDRRGFSASGGDDDFDGRVDEDFPNGRDDDGDGAVDEDYDAISQQMFACEYWDNTDEARSIYPDHRPLNLHVRQRSFAWSTPGANEFIGFDYVVINEGWEVLRQIYLGYFVDSDIGLKSASQYPDDDMGAMVRIDTTYTDLSINYACTDPGSVEPRDCRLQDLHIDLAYMFDTPGNQPGGQAADDMPLAARGYFGGMFLEHTTDPTGVYAPAEVGIHTLAFFSGSGTYPQGDPANDYQRYELLSSGRLPERGGTTQPADYRYCFSAGPFKELLPGEQLSFQVAFVIGSGREGMIHNSLMAQRVFDGQWHDVDDNLATGCRGRETCVRASMAGEPAYWHNPCDSLAPVEVFKNTDCTDPSVWRDQDCNCCTPLQDPTGCGRETMVRWVGSVAPPPPRMNLDEGGYGQRDSTLEGDRRVRIAWDNASELVPDPIRQRILFTGYKLWRVEGWRRPLGSIGPAPSEWQLMATLTRHPAGSQLDLDDYTDETVAPTGSTSDPEHPGEMLPVYPVGRYFYEDSLGLKNGMVYFYDVTAYSSWYDAEGNLVIMDSQPAAIEADAVTPMWAAVSEGWKEKVIVVPNPWKGRAAWDLTPSDADPTGTKIAFARLPARDCGVRVYTLAGDLVAKLANEGRGTVFWNLISRNGQDVTTGVYLYTVTCGGETLVGRFTVIR